MADRQFLDWPFLNDGHRDLANRLEAWCEDTLQPFVEQQLDHRDVDQSCRALLALLAEGGWTRYAVPAAYGGVHAQLDVRSLCLIRETLGRYCALADFVFAMQGLGSGSISLFGSEAQKQRYLPAVASGAKMAAFALTELDSGSDVANTKSHAQLDGHEWLINGAKTFISNGGIADYYVTFVRSEDAPGAKGLSAIIVDADSTGLCAAERIEVIAPHPLATLRFNDCRVPEAQLLGERGQGFTVAMATLDIFRSTVGAAALGFARRALDEMCARASERQLFNAPLHHLQLVQAMIADSALDVDAAALLVYRAAWHKDVYGGRSTREAAMAKMQATEQAQKVIDRAVQVFGGMGVVSGVKVEELYREIRALRIYEGATEVQKVVIARTHLAEYAASQP